MKQFATSKYSIVAQGEDNKWYAVGRTRMGHFASDNNSWGEFKDVTSLFEPVKSLNIVEVSSGTHFTCFITDTGKLYIRGNFFLE